MKSIFSEIRPALVSTGILAVVCCGLYPLAVTGIAKAAFREKADGSLIRDPDGTVRGSELIGQNFTGDGYFQPRPSASGANGYDAAASSGSNLGPTSRKLADLVRERISAYRTLNGLPENEPVPADAVTASGSGLDPHISPRNAELQARRVAEARKLTLEETMSLIGTCTRKPDLGFLGEPGVNVVKLNLALDDRSSARP